jgi:hypothetical protein
MIAVLNGRSDWRLISRTTSTADLLARITADDETPGWHTAMRCLRDGDGVLVVASSGDGHYLWRFLTPDGDVLAESPPVHRDEQACRDSFATAQRAAHTALGPTHIRPGHAPAGARV